MATYLWLNLPQQILIRLTNSFVLRLRCVNQIMTRVQGSLGKILIRPVLLGGKLSVGMKGL